MALLATSLKKFCRELLSLGTSHDPERDMGREIKLGSQQLSHLDMKELGLLFLRDLKELGWEPGRDSGEHLFIWSEVLCPAE